MWPMRVEPSAVGSLDLIAHGVLWYPSGGQEEEAGTFYGKGCTVALTTSAGIITRITLPQAEMLERLLYWFQPIDNARLEPYINPSAFPPDPGNLIDVSFWDPLKTEPAPEYFMPFIPFQFAIWRQQAFEGVAVPVPE